MAMLQGSPREINSPALALQRVAWAGVVGQSWWQGLAFAVRGENGLIMRLQERKVFFFSFFISSLFLFFSTSFLLVSGDGKYNYCLSQAGLKPTGFNARWENMGSFRIGRQSLLTSKKDFTYFSLFLPICQGEPQGEKSSAALNYSAAGWAGRSKGHLPAAEC